MELDELLQELVGGHRLVDEIRLVGSRATGPAHELSDWDFAVETSDFARLAGELPHIVEPLQPLAAQWDRYSDHACYMLVLRGPTKVDLIFPDEKQSWAGAWKASSETLVEIDRHFWDWILWLAQKERSGTEAVVSKSLGDMHRLMLEPMGADNRPGSISEAVDLYLDRRDELEQRFGVRVPRELESEVRPALS
ncbi:MAG TPA: nucleotidyltransferase domain-containing protein [Gaiellaceae bacterium]|jgi:Nucleotidyltransferase domain